MRNRYVYISLIVHTTNWTQSLLLFLSFCLDISRTFLVHRLLRPRRSVQEGETLEQESSARGRTWQEVTYFLKFLTPKLPHNRPQQNLATILKIEIIKGVSNCKIL